MTSRRPGPRSVPGRGARRRLAALAMAGACVVAACGPDAGVVSISATQTPDDSVPADTDRSTPSEGPEDATTVPTTPETGPDESTVPPIVEPELFADVALADVADVGAAKPTRDHDGFVAVALTDIARWWSEVYPEIYGEPFEDLEGGVYVGYPERRTPIPGCGGGQQVTEYPDLQLFVAFYCEIGDFMAYDDGDGEGEFGPSILTPLAREYGSAVMGVVLAHEYGHAIQGRIGALDRSLPTIITEQQADCFAGAWTGQAYRGESDLLRLGDRDVRAGLLAMLSVRDPVGTDQFVPGGHGSAFDRVGAFQEGFLNGPARCAPLLDEPLPLVPNQFRDSEDLRRGGNASYDCSDDPDPNCRPAPEFLADDLDHFWASALGDFGDVTAVPVDRIDPSTCDDAVLLAPFVMVCPGDRTLVFDEPQVRELYDEFGDFTIGYLYGIGWAELAQRAIDSPLSGEPRALLSDCFTGAWVRDITPDSSGLTPRGDRDEDGDGIPDGIRSSPGDLDEAIQMVILVGDEGAGVDRVGSPFEKIDALRTGVLGGLDACTDLVG